MKDLRRKNGSRQAFGSINHAEKREDMRKIGEQARHCTHSPNDIVYSCAQIAWYVVSVRLYSLVTKPPNSADPAPRQST